MCLSMPRAFGSVQGQPCGQAALGLPWSKMGPSGARGQPCAPDADDGPRTRPLPSLLSSLKLANEDKEQKLALLEEARMSVGREAGELRASLQEVERSRLEARRELQELRRQVRPWLLPFHTLWPASSTPLRRRVPVCKLKAWAAASLLPKRDIHGWGFVRDFFLGDTTSPHTHTTYPYSPQKGTHSRPK